MTENPLDLIRQQQADNRLLAAQAAQQQARAEAAQQPTYTYLGTNAETGMGVVQANGGGEAVQGKLITNGSIKPGQAVQVAGSGGSLPTIDQKPRPRQATASSTERSYPGIWIAAGARLFIGYDSAFKNFTEPSIYPRYSTLSTAVGLTMFPGGSVLDFARIRNRWFVLGSSNPDGNVPICWSSNGGKSWAACQDPINPLRPDFYSFLAAGESTLCMLSNLSVLTSLDLGYTWQYIPLDLRSQLRIDNPGSIFSGDRLALKFFGGKFWILSDAFVQNSGEDVQRVIAVWVSEDGLTWAKNSEVSYDLAVTGVYGIALFSAYLVNLAAGNTALPTIFNGQFPTFDLADDRAGPTDDGNMSLRFVSPSYATAGDKILNGFLWYRYSAESVPGSAFVWDGAVWQRVDNPFKVLSRTETPIDLNTGGRWRNMAYSRKAGRWVTGSSAGSTDRLNSIGFSTSRDGITWTYPFRPKAFDKKPARLSITDWNSSSNNYKEITLIRAIDAELGDLYAYEP